jgi:type IV pilus assembly protein PilV
MLMHTPKPFKSAQQGVVLIEAMIAILIFSMGVLAIVGLQATMIKNTSDSKYRAEAGYIAQQRIGLLWADPANLPADPSTTTIAIADLPSGSVSITRAGVQFTVTVTWQSPGADEVQHNFTTTASIAGGV